MALVFESPILTRKSSVSGQFRPQFADGEFFSDTIIGKTGNYVPPPPVVLYLVDQSNNNFVDQLGNVLIAS